MKKIVLVGPPGVGKSTISRRFSENGLRAVDLDDEIQRRTGRHPSEIISSFGEREFREEEHRALIDVLSQDVEIISVGGGTFCFERNRDAINRTGNSVYLQEEEEELARRILSDELQHRKTGKGAKRPVLYSGEDSQSNEPDLERTKLYIQKLIAERASSYAKAHLTVICTGKDEKEIVSEILTLVARRNVECL